MPAFKVTWTQTAIASASVDVELDELAAWAIRAGVIHSTATTTPDQAALRDSLERNSHLRDALLRLYATRASARDTK